MEAHWQGLIDAFDDQLRLAARSEHTRLAYRRDLTRWPSCWPTPRRRK